MRRLRLRRQRGQSMVELALCLPILLLVALGAVDLAEAYHFDVDSVGASRAGMRAGIVADSMDIGDAVRTEPNSVVPDTQAAWGATGPGGAAANCTTGQTGAQPCGDPNGCDTNPNSATYSFSGSTVACFAIRACILGSGSPGSYVCSAYGPWGTRPEQGSGQGDGLQIVVVFKYQPYTARIAQLVGGGSFYLRGASTGLELYY